MIMMRFQTIILLLVYIQEFYFIKGEGSDTCSRTLPKCQNDDKALFCHLDKIFYRLQMEKQCIEYFDMGFCNHADERAIMRKNCAKTYKDLCNQHNYIAYSVDPTFKYEPNMTLRYENFEMEMYRAAKSHFATDTCEKALKVVGCVSNSLTLNALTVAEYCPKSWSDSCRTTMFHFDKSILLQDKRFDFTKKCVYNNYLKSMEVNIELTALEKKTQDLKSQNNGYKSKKEQLINAILVIQDAKELQDLAEEFENKTKSELAALKTEASKYMTSAKTLQSEAVTLKQKAEENKSKSINKTATKNMLNEVEASKTMASQYIEKSKILKQKGLNYIKEAESVEANILNKLQLIEQLKVDTERSIDQANSVKKQVSLIQTEIENSLGKKTDGISALVLTIQKDAKNLNAAVTTTQKNIENIENLYSLIKDKVQSQDASAVAMQQDIQAFYAKVTQIQQDIHSVDDSDKVLLGSILGFQQKIQENQKLEALEIEIKNLTTLLKNSQQEIKDFQDLKALSRKKIDAMSKAKGVLIQINNYYRGNTRKFAELKMSVRICCPKL